MSKSCPPLLRPQPLYAVGVTGGQQGGERLRLQARKRRRRGVPFHVAIALVVLAVGAALWLNRPFQAELGTYRTSLADRTEAQLHNIHQAIEALDGVVIEPGETFSFNATVGPRTAERGYRQAPAFMERDLVTSVGGGICQVSSTLYNAGVLAGLEVVERHPHFRLVASVPAGRDATVWFGMADLRLKNPGQAPVRLSLRAEHSALRMVVQGRAAESTRVQLVTRPVPAGRPGLRSFLTERILSLPDGGTQRERLSFDTYRP